MNLFVELLRKQEDYVSVKGALLPEIEEAEKKLGLAFSKEYKEYLLECGSASAGGHEFTGIINSGRLNVVCATKIAKCKCSFVPDNFYLIEDSGIDNTFLWQDENGNVYQTIGDESPILVSESIGSYFANSLQIMNDVNC